jgi:hypothetical protein
VEQFGGLAHTTGASFFGRRSSGGTAGGRADTRHTHSTVGCGSFVDGSLARREGRQCCCCGWRKGGTEKIALNIYMHVKEKKTILSTHTGSFVG